MAEDNTDLTLVKQVQQGNKQAFNFLVAKYQYKVVSIAQKYVSDLCEAQDIAQEAFIKAYRAIGEFRGESAFFTWIYRITVNTAMNYLAGNKRRGTQVDVDAPEVGSYDGMNRLHEISNPENMLEGAEAKALFFRLLKSLPEELRQALILREIEEMSYEDMAVAMDCPVGTVRSRIFRAREIIERQLSSHNAAEKKA